MKKVSLIIVILLAGLSSAFFQIGYGIMKRPVWFNAKARNRST